MFRRLLAAVIIILAILPFSAPFTTCSLVDFAGRDSSSVALFDIKSPPPPLDETRTLEPQEGPAVHRQFSGSDAVALKVSIVDEVALDEDTLHLVPLYQRPSAAPLVALRL
jgi:hypothetical protein